MIKTVKQACRFNPIIRDYRMAQGIENIAEMIAGEGDGHEFFARNFVTRGMEQLFRECLLRLSGKSDQAVYELSQAMGGGKTHMMIALGLLARHPQLRPEILPEGLVERLDFDVSRLAAFTGRNSPDHYIWGEIAIQLGEAQAIGPYWRNGPKAVDQNQWKKIIGDKPTLILLDELPPYLNNASTQAYGDGTLADMVVYSISNLMTAALELPRCAVVLSNLSGSYGEQTKSLRDAISNLQQETRRQAMTITPVQLAGNEIYEILKKRLIDELPDDGVVSEIAEEYARQVKKGEDAGYIIAPSLDQIARQVRETYPFHPSFKHLVALFKENEGFRQTRGLMQFTARLLKSVEERQADDVFLIGAQHLNFNDEQVKDEIQRIAPKLQPALARDVADNGNAIAETIDAEMNGDYATQVMSLLLASSLSRAVGGPIGLSEGEIIEYLAAPNRNVDEFLRALQLLKERAWYLHREDQRYFVKETENLSRQIERNAKEMPQPKVDEALIDRLNEILEPKSKRAYQKVAVLPKLNDLNLNSERTLIVVKPDGKMPPGELRNLFDYERSKNNFFVLTGQDSRFGDAAEDRLRELCAVTQIFSKLKPDDTIYEEARDRMEEAEGRFKKALSAAYNRIYFPGVDVEGDGMEKLLGATFDNGLMLGSGEQSAEAQIENLLADARCNYKLALDLTGSKVTEYFAYAEDYLWPSGSSNRRAPWSDVLSRSKCNPVWTWMPGARGLEALKEEAVRQGRWRDSKDGYIEKGPFPKEKTTVNVKVNSTQPETGKIQLNITPKFAGESPKVLYGTLANDLSKMRVVENLENFETKEASLYFVAVDPTGKFETGEPFKWVADIKIRHLVEPAGETRLVTLASTPKAVLRYTLDGTNPKDGAIYDGPFEIGAQEALLLVHAKAGEAEGDANFRIPATGDNRVQIDGDKPAVFRKKTMLDSIERIYEVVNRFRNQPGTLFKGLKIEMGEAEKTVTLNFGAREVTAETIDRAISGLRALLNDDQAPVAVFVQDHIRFDPGHGVREYAKIAGIELKAGDVSQEI